MSRSVPEHTGEEGPVNLAGLLDLLGQGHFVKKHSGGGGRYDWSR